MGTILEGRYRIVGELGAGGIGRIYRAEHLKLGHDVAIKMLLPQYADHAMMRPRFEREAKALASLSHPHIVTPTDYSVAEGQPYLVMELLAGCTLQERLAAGPIEEPEARRIAQQIVEALGYAHAEGFVHRDLKPANVFLCELPNDPYFVKLLDFGFVKLISGDASVDNTVLTQSGVAFGTPSYMSPEQATGDSMDARTDIYSMGVILFEMIAGRRPFIGKLPEIVRQHLTEPVPELSVGGRPIDFTPPLRALLDAAMAKDKAGRLQSAEAFREALLALPSPWVQPSAAMEPTLLAPASSVEATKRARPTPRQLASEPLAAPPVASRVPPAPARAGKGGLVGGLLLALAAGVGATWWFVVGPEPAGEGVGSPQSVVGAEPLAHRSGQAVPGEPVPEPGTEALASLLDEISGDPHLPESRGVSSPEPAGPPSPDVDPDADELPPPNASSAPPAAARSEPEDTESPAEPQGEALDEQGGEPAEPEEDLLGPNPWRTRPVRPALVRARRRVLAGNELSGASVRRLRAAVRRDRSDPRPHLLLAQSFVAGGRSASALERYDLAYRVDDEARGDPRMLFDLLRLATEGDERASATAMLQRIYGQQALPAIDELLDASELSEERLAALRAVRERLEGEAPSGPRPIRRATPSSRARRAPRRRARTRTTRSRRSRRRSARSRRRRRR